MAHSESSLRSRCNAVALVFMAELSIPYGLQTNQRNVDMWLPLEFREKIEHFVRATHLEQGGRWSASNKRMPCDVLDQLAPWALESILTVDPTYLRACLHADESAGGLFSPSARPQRLSRRIRDPNVARQRLEQTLRDHFAASREAAAVGSSDELASQCAVVNLTELAVHVMISKPATPALLSMGRTLAGGGLGAAEPAALLLCLRSRSASSCRPVRPVRVEAGEDDDEEPDQDSHRDEELQLMTLRQYLATMSKSMQGRRDRKGLQEFNALLTQLERTDCIQRDWNAHLDRDERENQAVVFVVVATVARQQHLLGTVTLQVLGRARVKVADAVTSARDPRDNTLLRGRGVLKNTLGAPSCAPATCRLIVPVGIGVSL